MGKTRRRVRSHTRRMPDGRVIRVDDYQRSGWEAFKERLEPVGKKRRKRRTRKKARGWLSPGRGWGRILRAVEHARKRRKATAAALAVAGVAEIGGFLAARGTGAVVMVVAMGLTALAGGLLAASGGGPAPATKRKSPRAAPPRSGPRKAQRRPKNTTRTRTVYAEAPEAESFEKRHENTIFEDEGGQRVNVRGEPIRVDSERADGKDVA